VQFGKLVIDPARNPAILDTATWAPADAWNTVQALDESYWQSLQEAAARGMLLPSGGGLTPHASSCVRHEGALICLASLADGQQVFIEIGSNGKGGQSVLGTPVGTKLLSCGAQIAMHKTDAAVIARFFRCVAPHKGPRALGAVPRLGIGTRMTTAVWPAIWRAMGQGGFMANAIQNSVRELNLLEDLLAGRPPERNVAFGFGTIEAGYTGSTFEGLWVAGVLSALQHGPLQPFGADADHIQVKRGADGLERARRIVAAARYYSFYTLDVSDILDYKAPSARAAAAEAYLEAKIPDSGQRRAVLAYHGQPRRIGGQGYRPDRAALGCLVGKYWDALDAVQELYEYIAHLKEGQPFDLELSIDEHPPEVATFECLTTEVELAFLLLEMRRRGIPLTHIAPNFGIEKGTDYRCPDGLEGLEKRIWFLSRIAEEFGVMLDFHSGDDLSPATRKVIRRATGGRNHFKISPGLQLLYAQVLADFYPELFQRWWDDAVAYARREAAAGSALAAECLRQYETADDPAPSPHHSVFHHFSFAFVGRRDTDGQFLQREEFYALAPAFYRAYQDRVVLHLCKLAEDLF